MSSCSIPAALQIVPPHALEEYVQTRIRSFSDLVLQRLVQQHGLNSTSVQAALAEVLGSLPAPFPLGSPLAEAQHYQLVFRHDCVALGCLDPQCTLCQHNPQRRCTMNFDRKYLVNDTLKAKCTAAIRVELVHQTTGQLADLELAGMKLEVCVLDGHMYETKFLESGRQLGNSAEDDEELDSCCLLLNKKKYISRENGRVVSGCVVLQNTPLLVSSGGGSNDAAGRIILQLQGGRAVLPELSITDSSEAILLGRKPPFRLLVRTVWGNSGSSSGSKDGSGSARAPSQGPPPGVIIRPAVSEGFVVATRRTRTAGKVDIPSVDDPISKLEHMGKETVKKLADIRSAAAQAGIDLPLIPENCVTKVGEFKQLALRVEQDGHLRQRLQNVLKLSKEKWDEAREHALRAVVADSRPRAWYVDPHSCDLGLLFGCRLGCIDLERPLALLQPASQHKPGQKHDITPMPQLSPAQRDIARQLLPQAAMSWWQSGHPGWAMFIPPDLSTVEPAVALLLGGGIGVVQGNNHGQNNNAHAQGSNVGHSSMPQQGMLDTAGSSMGPPTSKPNFNMNLPPGTPSMTSNNAGLGPRLPSSSMASPVLSQSTHMSPGMQPNGMGPSMQQGMLMPGTMPTMMGPQPTGMLSPSHGMIPHPHGHMVVQQQQNRMGPASGGMQPGSQLQVPAGQMMVQQQLVRAPTQPPMSDMGPPHVRPHPIICTSPRLSQGLGSAVGGSLNSGGALSSSSGRDMQRLSSGGNSSMGHPSNKRSAQEMEASNLPGQLSDGPRLKSGIPTSPHASSPAHPLAPAVRLGSSSYILVNMPVPPPQGVASPTMGPRQSGGVMHNEGPVQGSGFLQGVTRSQSTGLLQNGDRRDSMPPGAGPGSVRNSPPSSNAPTPPPGYNPNMNMNSMPPPSIPVPEDPPNPFASLAAVNMITGSSIHGNSSAAKQEPGLAGTHTVPASFDLGMLPSMPYQPQVAAEFKRPGDHHTLMGPPPQMNHMHNMQPPPLFPQPQPRAPRPPLDMHPIKTENQMQGMSNQSIRGLPSFGIGSLELDGLLNTLTSGAAGGLGGSAGGAGLPDNMETSLTSLGILNSLNLTPGALSVFGTGIQTNGMNGTHQPSWAGPFARQGQGLPGSMAPPSWPANLPSNQAGMQHSRQGDFIGNANNVDTGILDGLGSVASGLDDMRSIEQALPGLQGDVGNALIAAAQQSSRAVTAQRLGVMGNANRPN